MQMSSYQKRFSYEIISRGKVSFEILFTEISYVTSFAMHMFVWILIKSLFLKVDIRQVVT